MFSLIPYYKINNIRQAQRTFQALYDTTQGGRIPNSLLSRQSQVLATILRLIKACKEMQQPLIP